MLWLIFAAMLLASLALLLWPLLSARGTAPARAEHDLAVYRQQLGEIAIELERGTLSDADAAAAKLEIERRMLRVGEELSQQRQGRSRWRNASAVAVAVAVPAASLAFYLWTGHPEMPAQLFGERRNAGPATAGNAQAGQIADMVERLRQRLATSPGDPQGWKLLGRSYVVMGRFDEAVAAYRKASDLAPDDPDMLMAYGEAQVFAAQDDVTPAAEAIFKRTLALDPKHPGARFYLALQRAQAGDMKGALDGWLALYADSAADAPWLPALQAQMKRAAAALKIDLASVLPKPLPPTAAAAPAGAAVPPAGAAAPGPSAEDVAAASKMAPADQAQMIQGMVQRLADRLQQNPDDFDGWMRLGRAYQVLNQPDKAREAYGRAAALRPADATAKQALAALAAPGANPAPPMAPAPAPAVPAAAPQVPAGDQGAMIRSMVQRLADRLQQHPDDFEGWTKLGRAYSVLGDKRQALSAYSKAAALRPRDADALLNQADAITQLDGGGTSLPPQAEALYREVLALQPDNPDALWYVGLAERQAGRPQVAVLHWERLLSKLDPSSGEYKQVRQSIDALQQAR